MRRWGFQVFLSRAEWGEASACGGPKVCWGQGVPCNWEMTFMYGTGLAGVCPSVPAVSCPGGCASGQSGLGFSGKVEHPQPVCWAWDCWAVGRTPSRGQQGQGWRQAAGRGQGPGRWRGGGPGLPAL